MFKNPFSFNGRIRRTEYGLSYLIYIIIAAIANLYLQSTENDNGTNPIILMLIFLAYMTVFWFLLAQGAKRCHDRGNSGWYQLIPFYGLWMLFTDSEIGENKYGTNPKGIGNGNEINEIGKNQPI